MTKYSIKQLTNFSSEVKTAETVNHNVLIDETRYVSQPYKIIDFDYPIIKIGYICEPKAISYPIFIKNNNTLKQVYIKPNGIFEIQPEVLTNIEGDTESEDVNLIVNISSIHVPSNMVFNLDFVYSIN